MTALGNAASAQRILRTWLSRHPASMLIAKTPQSDDQNSESNEAIRLRLVDGETTTTRR